MAQPTQDSIATRMREIFDAAPAIVGFAFTDLLTVDVELERWPGYTWSDEARAEYEMQIAHFARQLMDDHTLGVAALRGRTFARTVQ